MKVRIVKAGAGRYQLEKTRRLKSGVYLKGMELAVGTIRECLKVAQQAGHTVININREVHRGNN